MTLAAASSTSTQSTASQTVPIVVLGADALLAAAPATPVQLAHACLRAGFANVIPATWGDELIAAAALRRLSGFGSGPAIHCSCPIVAHRLLTVGGDLRPVMLTLVSPPVAIARYVRTLSHPSRLRITYVGGCPGANDDAIDIRMSPDALIAMLAEREIAIEDQPRVFESIIPPDRRRFRSQPGGLPAVDALWSEFGSRALVEVGGEDLVAEVAQHLLTGKSVLIDAAARLGCVCAGAVSGVSPGDARAQVVALEPPRSTTPVIDERAPIELDAHIPAASRTPIDVAAVPQSMTTPHLLASPRSDDVPLGHRLSPIRGTSAAPETRTLRPSNPGLNRPVQGAVPVSRDGEGKSLPRAYVARRRSSPRGIAAVPAIAAPLEDTLLEPRRRSSGARSVQAPAPSPAAAQASAPSPIIWSLPPRQMLYVLAAAVVFIIGLSAVVAVVVGRSISSPPASAPTQR